MLSNSELIGLFIELETELQDICPDAIDYFPVIRSFLYTANRPSIDPKLKIDFKPGFLGKLLSTCRALPGLLMAFFNPIRQERLFVAPARHRSIRQNGSLLSKHLDSLHRACGTDKDLTWEVGSNPNMDSPPPSVPQNVARLAAIASRLKPRRQRIKRIETVVTSVLERHPDTVTCDVELLMYSLSAHDISRVYYQRIFAKSALETGYVVVFYGLRQLPITAALNALGIETVEYQHGIQNEMHPMYTNWGHLHRKPDSLPGKMLLWDEVSRRRIDKWAAKFDVETEIVGNLWLQEQLGAASSLPRGKAILVALQLFPGFFNFEILKVIEATGDIRWIFREHPIHPIGEEDRERLLSRYPNLEIVGSKEETLEESLARSACCITGFSTVGIEALLFSRTVIFTHENAREGLADYIDGERCFYADNADSILAIVRQLPDASSYSDKRHTGEPG